MSLDLFTQKRMSRFVQEFRKSSGQLPTLNDFKAAGFGPEQVEDGIKLKMIEMFYVTLSNGTIVKGYKLIESNG